MQTVSASPMAVLPGKSVSNGMFGMIFFLAFEVMFFAALISALVVNKATAGAWPPPDQPRLPVISTAINSMFLLLSAATIFLSGRKRLHGFSRQFVGLTLLLGLLFVFLQGWEWTRLIGYGLTTSSSLYGAFFYLIIGMHAVHVLIGTCLLAWVWNSTGRGHTAGTWKNRLAIGRLYWYFVVGIWPVLYFLVYLN